MPGKVPPRPAPSTSSPTATATVAQTFLARQGTRTAGEVEQGVVSNAVGDEADALRTFIRDTHAEINGIKRGKIAKELGGLRTLDELTTRDGLEASARDLSAFLGNAKVRSALAPFLIGEPDHHEVQRLLAAWKATWLTSHHVRASHGTARKSNIDARTEFVNWLGTWWAIAKVRLKSQPHVLAALGVETRTRRGKSKDGQETPATAPAVVEPAEA